MNAIHAIVPHTQSDVGQGSTATLPSSAGLNDMFLQLLVAQLQNQSPLNPMDPTQFVGQLAQFSELSEITQIRELVQHAVPAGSNSVTNDSSRGMNLAIPRGNASSLIARPAAPPVLLNAQRTNAEALTQVPRALFEHAVQGAF